MFLGKGLCFVKNMKEVKKDDAILASNSVCGLDCFGVPCEPLWESRNEAGGIKLAEFCDFNGEESYNVVTHSVESCARLCEINNECTQFTFTADRGRIIKITFI